MTALGDVRTAPAPSADETRIAVAADGARARCTFSGGTFRPRVLETARFGARVALVPTTALLLGGDRVTIDVEVGAGAWLELVETAGTVAYPGPPASWDVRIRLEAGAVLVWAGLPFVACEGADVARSTEVDVADGARLVLRETLVLGRAGEGPGVLRNRLAARRGGRELLVEDLDLGTPPGRAPGVLGPHRVLDTVSALGFRPDAEERSGGDAGERSGAHGPAQTVRLDLAGPGALARFIGDEAHRSGLDRELARWGAQAQA